MLKILKVGPFGLCENPICSEISKETWKKIPEKRLTKSKKFWSSASQTSKILINLSAKWQVKQDAR